MEREEAVNWLLKAAKRGQDQAQYVIGGLYMTGLGLEKDPVLAHMWFSLAVKQGNESAAEWLEKIAKKMTVDEIAEAERRAQEWAEADAERPPDGK